MEVINDREYEQQKEMIEVLKDISSKMDDLNREMRETKVRLAEMSR